MADFAQVAENQHFVRSSQAVYVPSMQQSAPRAYRYGFKVLMGKETDFSLVAHAVSQKWVYYDPGIKMETLAGRKTSKRRSQFRVNFRHLTELYQTSEWRDLRLIAP